MLKQRVITALLLLAILIPAVLHPAPEVFGVVALILIAAGAWEWGKLNQLSHTASIGTGILCAAVCLVSWYSGLLRVSLGFLWIAVGCGWVLIGAWLLQGGVSAWSRVPRTFKLVGGLIALWAAWLAVLQARMVGHNFLFSVLVLVWVADVFAYFFGRALGGRFIAQKLAVTISPGKSWEGAIGGLLGVLACAFLWRSLDSQNGWVPVSLYSELGAGGAWFMVVAVVFMGAMSVVGDLVESLFKRSAGVKDSSGLLPGHGGVLDRVDALLPILPLAMMLTSR